MGKGDWPPIQQTKICGLLPSLVEGFEKEMESCLLPKFHRQGRCRSEAARLDGRQTGPWKPGCIHRWSRSCPAQASESPGLGLWPCISNRHALKSDTLRPQDDHIEDSRAIVIAFPLKIPGTHSPNRRTQPTPRPSQQPRPPPMSRRATESVRAGRRRL